MRILITGVSGYAGFHAARRLAAVGHEVTGLARHPEQPRLEALRAHEVTIACGDVAEPDSYRELLERTDVMIHALLDKKNLIGTDRALIGALAALPERSGRRRRLIYTTGCSIFGKVPVPVDESAEPNPEHGLAFRRGLELEALALKNIGVVVLRPGFMYGIDGFNSVSTDWFDLAEGGAPVFRGDREKAWSWVHIDDLAEAYRIVVEADESIDGEVFHLGDEHRPLCVDVMRGCLAAAGYTGELRFGPPQAGDNASTWFDQNEIMTSEKARRRLGWQPRRLGILHDLPAAYASYKATQRIHGSSSV